MKATIIAGGRINNYKIISRLIDKRDFIICADHGYDHAVLMNIKPDLVVGDMDSVYHNVKGVNKKVYPKEKDFTDTELAVLEAIKLGFYDISLYAALGNRPDHFLSNLFIPYRFKKLNAKITIHDELSYTVLIKDKFEASTKPAKTISLIPLTDCMGVNSTGLKYPLKNTSLRLGECIGISNLSTQYKFSVSLKRGSLLAVIYR